MMDRDPRTDVPDDTRRDIGVPAVLVTGTVCSGSVELFRELSVRWPGEVAHRHLPESKNQRLVADTGKGGSEDIPLARPTLIMIVMRNEADRLADSFLLECTAPWRWPECEYRPPSLVPNPAYLGGPAEIASYDLSDIVARFRSSSWRDHDKFSDDALFSRIAGVWGLDKGRIGSIATLGTVEDFPHPAGKITVLGCEYPHMETARSHLSNHYGVRLPRRLPQVYRGILDEETVRRTRPVLLEVEHRRREDVAVGPSTRNEHRGRSLPVVPRNAPTFGRTLSILYGRRWEVCTAAALAVAWAKSVHPVILVLLALPFVVSASKPLRATLLRGRRILGRAVRRYRRRRKGPADGVSGRPPAQHPTDQGRARTRELSVLLFTPIKVASTSIHTALCDAFGVEEIRARSRYDREAYLESPIKIAKIHNLFVRGSEIRNDHDNLRPTGMRIDRPISVIVGVRDPMRLYVSAYFQNNRSRFLFPYHTFDPPQYYVNPLYFGSAQHLQWARSEDLVDHFLSIDWLSRHDCNGGYYLDELRRRFGIDLKERGFDTDRGFTIYEEGSVRLFAYRMEALRADTPGFIHELSRFAGAERLSLPSLNRTVDRPFADAADRFRCELASRRVPESLLRTYESDWVGVFWSRSQIETMRKAWLR